jgi:hypothetical protein
MSIVRNILNSTRILVNNYLPTTGSNTFYGNQNVNGEISASSINGLGNLTEYSSSVFGRLNQLSTTSGSNIFRLNNLENKTGSFATTGSNTFYGTQTFSGSLYVANDLIVQGSSSIQYISASSVSIGTNIVQLNTANPSVRYAGLSIIDSGSIGGSGSFLYDSVQDEFIFLHRGNGTNVTSSHFVLGPETYDSLGNETYLTNNRLPKGTGKEHLNDSNITDTGTLITLGSNTTITGTLSATGTALVSGSSQITFSGISSLPTLVSGSSQIDVMSTTNIARLATTGSNIFSGNQSITGSITSTDNITAGHNAAHKIVNSSNVQVGGFSRRGLWEGNANNDPAIWAEGGSGVYIYTNGSATPKLVAESGGTIRPGVNGTQDLGSASYRWSTVYTSDLSLNNGIGDWTIVEGEDDLFLYNNKKGKVYKFALTEVDPNVATPKKS